MLQVPELVKWQDWDLNPGIPLVLFVPSTPFLLDLDSILKGEAQVLSFFVVFCFLASRHG